MFRRDQASGKRRKEKTAAHMSSWAQWGRKELSAITWSCLAPPSLPVFSLLNATSNFASTSPSLQAGDNCDNKKAAEMCDFKQASNPTYSLPSPILAIDTLAQTVRVQMRPFPLDRHEMVCPVQ